LVVLIIIDQLPTRLFERARPLFSGGIKRLVDRGTRFVGEYPYANTVTATGHAFLATGAPPRDSGILMNAWIDRARFEPVTSVSDPVHGASPSRLHAEGISDVLRAETNGRAKIVAVSWKDRGAIILGGKKPDVAVWFDAEQLAFTTSSYYGALPGFVSEANKKRPASRLRGATWTASLDEATLMRLAGPDDAPGEGDLAGLGTTFPHRLPRSSPDFARALAATPFAAELLIDLAKDAVIAESLGADSVPDFLSISVSATDLLGHAMGMDSREALDLILRIDRALGPLFDLLDARVGADAWSAVLTSDHGVAPLPERLAAEFGLPAERFRMILDSDVARRVEKVLPGWSARFLHPWIWLSAPPNTTPRDRAAAIDRARAALESIDGVLGAFDRTQLVGTDGLSASIRASWDAELAGDLYVLPRPGVVYGDDDVPRGGTTHCSPWWYDTHVPIVVYGSRVETSTGSVPMGRVVSTVADLLGVRPPRMAHQRSLLAH
jgi:hypothetical protein